MRKYAAIVTLAALVLGIVSLAGCGPKEKVELVITSWGGLYGEAFEEEVVKPFEEAYDCEITLVNPGGSTQILAKLRAEKGNPSIDIVQIGGGLEAICVQEGLVADIDYSTLSNWGDLVPTAKMYPDFGPAGSLAAVGILYNTELMPFEPDSWYDFWREELAEEGKIGIHDMTGNYGLALMTIINELEGGDAENTDPGFAKFAELMATHKPLIEDSSDDPVNDIVQRGAYMTICPQSRAIGLLKEGFSAAFIYPKEGAFAWPTSIGIVAGTEHEELAKQFIDFFISSEINAAWATHVNYGPVNSKCDISDYEYAEELSPERIYDLDWEWINSKRSEWIERWNTEILPLLGG